MNISHGWFAGGDPSDCLLRPIHFFRAVCPSNDVGLSIKVSSFNVFDYIDHHISTNGPYNLAKEEPIPFELQLPESNIDCKINKRVCRKHTRAASFVTKEFF